MHFVTLPDELLVHMCTFLCVATLARLRETCSRWHMIADRRDAWINAFFSYMTTWYDLNDIVLADKFIRCGWSSPIPVPISANAVALWGTLVGADDRTLATFGPVIPTWTTPTFGEAFVEPDEDDDTHCSFMWSLAKPISVAWISDDLRTEYTTKGTRFASVTVHMHVLAQNATISIHTFVTGFFEQGVNHVPANDGTPQFVETGCSATSLHVDADSVWLDVFETGIDMHRFFRDEEDKQAQDTYVKNESASIRGWGNSRACLPSIILSRCSTA